MTRKRSLKNGRSPIKRPPPETKGLTYLQTPFEKDMYGCPCCNITDHTETYNLHCVNCHATGKIRHLKWSSILCPNCQFEIRNMFYTPENYSFDT